ncbi:hypothetical protein LV84_02636 [Algoriphagus ratkowskyi]|uniref:Uncharacterized protein n=1 Tax=Algoriphagus ratkowskyi TaxID=57028 RepID=A0A2W7R3U1_9BACT|nr:hypothetical protein LV84_02636 [Algoriphagus ratkowskyi]
MALRQKNHLVLMGLILKNNLLKQGVKTLSKARHGNESEK